MRKTKRMIMHVAVCCNCFKKNGDENGAYLWDSKDAAIKSAFDSGWVASRGGFYCDECVAKKIHLPKTKR